VAISATPVKTAPAGGEYELKQDSEARRPVEVIHQPEQRRFVVRVDEQEAWLDYQLLPRHGVNFTFTFVPENLRGHGIAERLVRRGLKWARAEGYSIEADCWYVRRFLR
jgi:predicted GNAT family acetyltransferase